LWAGLLTPQPENRDPDAQERLSCSPYLNSEILAMTNLKIIVTLGSMPTKAMGLSGSIVGLAGTPRKLVVLAKNVIVVPVFHPAAVLRRPTYLSTWESHWHQVKNLANPREESHAARTGAVLLERGLEGKNWRGI